MGRYRFKSCYETFIFRGNEKGTLLEMKVSLFPVGPDTVSYENDGLEVKTEEIMFPLGINQNPTLHGWKCKLKGPNQRNTRLTGFIIFVTK